MSTDPNTTKSDFLAAEEIKAILAEREKDEQERILRWVSESLGIVERRAAPPPGGTLPSDVSDDRGGARVVDVKSFVQEKQPKSDNQFTAVVAYYHRFMVRPDQRKETITTEDLRNAARLAGWGVFTQPDKPLSNALAQGYLDRAGRGEYRLNAVGENLVSMALPANETNSSAKGGRVKASRPSKRKAPRGSNGKRA